MPTIELKTFVNADIETCFDLARSIDLHILTTSKTNEKAIDGKLSGLIDSGEFVTWEATHFGVRQKLTSKITVYDRPFHFRDEQIKGIFKFIKHDHYFEEINDGVMMKDVFEYEAPFGFLGRIAEKLILTNYLKRFLEERNEIIKEYAETDLYKSLLK